MLQYIFLLARGFMRLRYKTSSSVRGLRVLSGLATKGS